MVIVDTLNRLRRPEYTGANRCAPCTVVNLLIAVVIGGALAIFVPGAAVPVFVGSLGAIYFRGYLVPGTPSLTKRYLPPHVLELFGKQPIEASVDGGTTLKTVPGAGSETTDSDWPLAAGGIVNRTETGTIDLTPAFRDEWREGIRTLRERTLGTEDVRKIVAADTVSRHGEQSFVVNGNTSVRWGSAAAFVADVAAASILDERLRKWESAEWDRRRSVLLGLRLCLDQCPSCDGPVETSEHRADPCCQKPHLMAEAICGECGAALADAAVVDHGDGESVRQRLLRL